MQPEAPVRAANVPHRSSHDDQLGVVCLFMCAAVCTDGMCPLFLLDVLKVGEASVLFQEQEVDSCQPVLITASQMC